MNDKKFGNQNRGKPYVTPSFKGSQKAATEDEIGGGGSSTLVRCFFGNDLMTVQPGSYKLFDKTTFRTYYGH